jgi:penicillin amidase
MIPRRSPRHAGFTALCLLPLAALALPGCGAFDETTNPVPKSASPAADIDLLVDDFGVTHVYAKTDTDAFFGAGYAVAKDRLFQMELARRGALGTKAELFGEKALTGDLAARTINFKKLGDAAFVALQQTRPEEAALVEAWARGVNKRIDEIKSGDAPRPYGLGAEELNFIPDPWTPAHTFAVGKVLAFGLSDTLEADILTTALQRFGGDAIKNLPYLMSTYPTYITTTTPAGVMPAGAPPQPALPRSPLPPSSAWSRPPGLFPAFASNNWAVSGKHTKNQKPLIAGDPHQPLTSPSRFWPVHVNSADAGGTLDVIGFLFVGTPMVELGHNAHIGWTATTNFADTMDIWDVAVAADKTSIQLGGQARPIEVRAETIHVRKSDAPVGMNDDRTFSIREVPGFGVLLPDEMLPIPASYLVQGSILFNWTGLSTTNESSAYLALSRAKDLDAFEAAVDLLDVGAVNFVAADANGIAYRSHAIIPDRGDPASHPMPWHVLSGDDAASLWTRGNLPPDKLPHLRDPERGFIITANNDPFGFTADGNVENDPYYYGAFYDSGFRAHRIEEALTELLQGGAKLDRADIEALQGDVHSPMADTLLPHLADAIGAIDTDAALAEFKGRADLQELAARLGTWDRRFDRAKAEPVIFYALEWFAAKRLLEGPMTAQLFNAIAGAASGSFLAANLRNVLEKRFTSADQLTPSGPRALLLAALSDTAAWLTQSFGGTTAKFTLADVQKGEFTSDFGGKFDSSKVSVGGSFDTINVAAAPFFINGAPSAGFTSIAGSLYRMVIGFAADGTPEATLDFARGVSGEPSDPHFADQQESWLLAAHKPLPFRRADVDARTTEKLVTRDGSR